MFYYYLVMHPKYKTAYFKLRKWPQEWIREAVSLARSAWEEYKINLPTPPSQVSGAASSETNRKKAEVKSRVYIGMALD
jgi:hypothetical protein